MNENRESVLRLLKAGHPDAPVDDDEAIFGLIIDDYADYARLLELEQHYEADIAAAEVRGRNAQIEETLRATPPTDGTPHLTGANAYTAANPNSIFSLARGA